MVEVRGLILTGVTFYYQIFLYYRSKASEAQIAIIANSVSLWKNQYKVFVYNTYLAFLKFLDKIIPLCNQDMCWIEDP